MKLILIFLISCSIITYSQEFEKIQKKYTLEDCHETNFVIASRKGMAGIYNKSLQKFSIEPRQSDFYYFEKYEILFEFTAQNKVLAYNLKADNFPNDYVESDAENKLRVLKGIYYEYRKGDYYFQNELFGQLDSSARMIKTTKDSLTLINPTLTEIPDYIQLSFGVEKVGDFVIVTDLHIDSNDPNPIPYASFNYPDEDSIDDNGNTVYPPEIKGSQNSGIFNLKSRKWTLEPTYFVICTLNDFIFCNKQDEYNEEIFYPGYGHWDIYKSENNALNLIKSDINWAKEIPVDKIFDVESYDFIEADSSYIQYTKNGQKGLYHLSLFYNQDYLNEGEPAYSTIELAHELVFEPIFKFIENTPEPNGYYIDRFFLYDHEGVKYVNLDPDQNEVSTVSAKTKISIREYGVKGNDYAEFAYWILDDKTYTVENGHLKLFSAVIENPMEKRLLNRRSIEVLNDSLVYSEFWKKQGTYWEPVYNYDNDYSIALNENGEELYYPPEPGEFKSGIYNLKQQKWHYPKENAWISRSHDNFQICNPILDSSGYYKTYVFKVDDLNHNLIEHEPENGELKTSNTLLVPRYKADTIYTVLGESSSYLGYFDVENKMGLYYNGYPEIILTPREYAYLKPEFGFYFSIDSDSSWLKMGSFDTTFSINSLKRISVIPANNLPPTNGDLFIQLESENNHVLIHAENNENVVNMPFSKEDYEAYYWQEIENQNWKFSFKRINDSLIYLEDCLADEKIADQTPIPSLVYEWEDSIDANGNAVYPELAGGYNRCGVYNQNSKDWVISKKYKQIQFYENQFLLTEAIRDKKGLITSYKYQIIDSNLNEIWRGDDFSTLPVESPFYRLIFG